MDEYNTIIRATVNHYQDKYTVKKINVPANLNTDATRRYEGYGITTKEPYFVDIWEGKEAPKVIFMPDILLIKNDVLQYVIYVITNKDDINKCINVWNIQPFSKIPVQLYMIVPEKLWKETTIHIKKQKLTAMIGYYEKTNKDLIISVGADRFTTPLNNI